MSSQETRIKLRSILIHNEEDDVVDEISKTKSVHHSNNSEIRSTMTGLRKWDERTIRELIELWRERPSLYDLKHLYYTNKNSRRKRMEEISAQINIPVEEIVLKMNNLRSYYAYQHRKKIEFEKEGKGNLGFTSSWKYFNSLGFLNNFMSFIKKNPKNKCSNNGSSGDYDIDNLEAEMIKDNELVKVCEENREERIGNAKYPSIINRVAQQPKRKLAASNEPVVDSSVDHYHFPEQCNRESNEMEEAKRKRRESIEHQHFHQTSSTRSEDEIFIDMLSRSLAKIAESEAKEALKIEIQNLVFKTRFGQQQGQAQGYRSPGSITIESRIENCNTPSCEGASSSDHCHAEVSRRKAAHPKRKERNL
eukprot:gene18616-20493_t